MTHNQELSDQIEALTLSPSYARARLISEEKFHLNVVYFSDEFVQTLRDDLDEATGLALFLPPINRLEFDDEFWRCLFQKSSRRELELQNLGNSDDRWRLDEVLQNMTWDKYIVESVLDTPEDQKPDMKVFRDVLLEVFGARAAGKQGKETIFHLGGLAKGERNRGV
jgi:hypothetical protein